MKVRNIICSFTLLLAAPTLAWADKTSESWIRIAGEVASVENQSFTLDYGGGNLSVAVEDWKWFKQQAVELRGMQVHVAGRLHGQGDEPTVKLLGIYLPGLHVCHYSDQSVAAALAQTNDIRNSNELVLNGRVIAVEGREFTLDTGERKLTVDTKKLLHNPMDNVGYQQIGIGHQVSVSTTATDDVFKSGRLEALRVISLISGMSSP